MVLFLGGVGKALTGTVKGITGSVTGNLGLAAAGWMLGGPVGGALFAGGLTGAGLGLLPGAKVPGVAVGDPLRGTDRMFRRPLHERMITDVGGRLGGAIKTSIAGKSSGTQTLAATGGVVGRSLAEKAAEELGATTKNPEGGLSIDVGKFSSKLLTSFGK